MAWSADGKTVVSGTVDRSVRYWDVATGKLRATLVADDKQIVAVNTEGNYRAALDVESELIYVIQTEKTQETSEPKAFCGQASPAQQCSGSEIDGELTR